MPTAERVNAIDPAEPEPHRLDARLHDALLCHAADADTHGQLPEEVLAALREAGILGTAIPTEYGGLGGTALLTNTLISQVAALDPSVAIILFQHFAVSSRISEWGSPQQKDRYLPQLASGQLLAASAWSESGAGADKKNLSTKAQRTATGWVLDGAKTFTTGAGLAQVYLVLAQTSAPTETGALYGSDGQTFFLVDADTPGLVADTGMDLVGMRASATGFVELHGCPAADTSVLGPVGQATQIIAGVRRTGATLGAVSLGIAEAAYQLALGHACRRGLSDAQAVRHRLVDLAAMIEGARALVERAGRRTGDDPGITTLLSKTMTSTVSEQVCAEVQRLLGSSGFLRDHPINKLARDARAVGLMGPTNDLCRELVSATWTR